MNTPSIKVINKLIGNSFGGFKRGEVPMIAAVNVAAQAQAVKSKPMDYENGHEVILRTLIRNRTQTEFRLLSGDVIIGVVTQFDKTTVTIRQAGKGKPTTIFKHAIETFSGLETLQ